MWLGVKRRCRTRSSLALHRRRRHHPRRQPGCSTRSRRPRRVARCPRGVAAGFRSARRPAGRIPITLDDPSAGLHPGFRRSGEAAAPIPELGARGAAWAATARRRPRHPSAGVAVVRLALPPGPVARGRGAHQPPRCVADRCLRRIARALPVLNGVEQPARRVPHHLPEGGPLISRLTPLRSTRRGRRRWRPALGCVRGRTRCTRRERSRPRLDQASGTSCRTSRLGSRIPAGPGACC